MRKQNSRNRKSRKSSFSDSHIRDIVSKSLTLAVKAHQSGDINQAEILYRKILQVDPNNADALHLLGIIAHQSHQNQASIDLISRAITVNPNSASFYFNLGVVLQEENGLRDACKAYKRAIKLQPIYPEAYENLGVALQDLEDFQGAMDAYEQALRLNPHSLLAHKNYGTLLNYMGQQHDAFIYLQRAVEIAPGDASSHMKYAMALLNQKKFVKGWIEYEWRWYDPEFLANNPPRIIPFPKWDGANISKKTILIYPEQGIGDEVMFASCFLDILSRARKCIIACDDRLTGIFARSFPGAQIIGTSLLERPHIWKHLHPIDYCVPAGSLPRFYRCSSDSFPNRKAYLKADNILVDKWRERLHELGSSLKVGISWKGGRGPRARRARSIELSDLQPILSVNGVQFINLQYGNCQKEITGHNRHSRNSIISFPEIDPLVDLEHFTALMTTLDLVISIDNSTIHFSGALGTSTWALLPCPADWRWFGDSDQSPWYSSLRLFRQDRPGSGAWKPLLTNVAEDLEKLAQGTIHQIAYRKNRYLSSPKTEDIPPRKDHEVPVQYYRSKRSSPSVVLLNDTSYWYHWGCSLTSLAIHQRLRTLGFGVWSIPINRIRALIQMPNTISALDDDSLFKKFSVAHPELVGMLSSADLVLVNGEGTLHGLGHTPSLLLYLAYISRIRYQKTVHMINHSCFPDNSSLASRSPSCEFYKKVYHQLSFVAVREKISANLVSQFGINVTQGFDCLPLYLAQYYEKPIQKQDYAVISGSAAWSQTTISALTFLIENLNREGLEVVFLLGANAYLAADDSLFINALYTSARHKFRIVNATSQGQWLRTIADARLMISGRFHHSITAAFLQTPFIVFESNTPKIDGLLEMLGVDALISTNDPSFPEAVFHRASNLLVNPGKCLINQATRSYLLELGCANFKDLSRLQ